MRRRFFQEVILDKKLFLMLHECITGVNSYAFVSDECTRTRKINTPSPPEGVEVWKVNYNGSSRNRVGEFRV